MSRPNDRNLPVDWQLPRGVAAGTWDYAQASFVAEGYDDDLAQHPLFVLDQQVVARYVNAGDRVVDLGCGTGRSLLPLAQRGCSTLGIDLSQAMLRVLLRKAQLAEVSVQVARGNLVELDFLGEESADCVLCLFSTLGMIQTAAARAQVVRHMARILRPGGHVVLHVHNYWHNLCLPAGRAWVLNDWLLHRWRGQERGDRVNDYLGIRNFFLHIFTQREMELLLQAAGLSICEWIPIDRLGDRTLRHGWFFPRIRAQGWIVVARRRSY